MDRIGRRVTVIGLLLVASTVGWRRGHYFTGSVDPVVLGKALLSGLALVLATQLAGAARRRAVGTGSLWFLAVVLGTSMLGALGSGSVLASGVLVVRVLLLASTVVLLIRSVPADLVLASIARACGLIAVLAAATGASAFVTGGRLAGRWPALAPNELALLAAVVVLHAAWRALVTGATARGLVAVAVMVAVMWATGSRTALLILVLALVIMGSHIRRVRERSVVAALVAGGAALVVALTTGVLDAFWERDGSGTSTLDSRLIAWRAAVNGSGSLWQLVLGSGLSTKVIQVRGQGWSTQPLDSSWVSLLVQAGVVGLATAVVWTAWVLRGVLKAPRTWRSLFVPLVVFLIGRSVLESGLVDATPAFLCFLAVSLLAEGASRARLATDLRDIDVDASAVVGGGPAAAGAVAADR